MEPLKKLRMALAMAQLRVDPEQKVTSVAGHVLENGTAVVMFAGPEEVTEVKLEDDIDGVVPLKVTKVTNGPAAGGD